MILMAFPPQIEYFFDGPILAHYLVSSRTFIHPISRRPLIRSECVLLDTHNSRYSMAPNVAEAYDHKQDELNAAVNMAREVGPSL